MTTLPPRRRWRTWSRAGPPGPSSAYGLGIRTYELPCGTFWGHDGDIFGSVTYTASTADGNHVLTLNTNDNWNDDRLYS